MPLKVYFDTTPESVFRPQSSGTDPALRAMSGHDMKALAEQHMNDKTPMSFYAISGAQDDMKKFVFRTTKHTYMAGAVGPKAEKIKDAAELHNLTPEQTAVFEIQTTTASARDWSAEPAKETRCGLLATFVRTATGVKELDEDESLAMQLGANQRTFCRPESTTTVSLRQCLILCAPGGDWIGG